MINCNKINGSGYIYYLWAAVWPNKSVKGTRRSVAVLRFGFYQVSSASLKLSERRAPYRNVEWQLIESLSTLSAKLRMSTRSRILPVNILQLNNCQWQLWINFQCHNSYIIMHGDFGWNIHSWSPVCRTGYYFLESYKLHLESLKITRHIVKMRIIFSLWSRKS